jgi:hypothetical protein
MFSEKGRLPENIKKIIDQKSTTSLTCRQVDDNFVKLLSDYLVQKDSTINSLSLIDTDVTTEGLQYLLDTYGSRLIYLNIAENCFSDEDLDALVFPKSLQFLCVSNNYFTEKGIERLHTLNLKKLEATAQQFLPDSSEITMSTSKPLSFQKETSRPLTINPIPNTDVGVNNFMGYLLSLDEKSRLNALADLADDLKTKCDIQIKLMVKNKTDINLT